MHSFQDISLKVLHLVVSSLNEDTVSPTDYKETERAVKKFTALFLCLYICSGSLSAADPLAVLGRGTAVVLFEIAAQ